MIDQDPSNLPFRQYGFVLGIALFGGVVSWFRKVRKGEIAVNSIMHLIGELTTASFAGLIAFWFCVYINAPGPLMACIVAISGHMGTKAITLFEEWAGKKIPPLDGGGK